MKVDNCHAVYMPKLGKLLVRLNDAATPEQLSKAARTLGEESPVPCMIVEIHESNMETTGFTMAIPDASGPRFKIPAGQAIEIDALPEGY